MCFRPKDFCKYSSVLRIQLFACIGRTSAEHCILRHLVYGTEIALPVNPIFLQCRYLQCMACSSTACKNARAASSSDASSSAAPIARPRSPNRPYAPSSTKVKTLLNQHGVEIPCGTWNNAPIGLLIPCTTVTDALLNATPASRAAAAI